MTDQELIPIAREQVNDFKDPEGHSPNLGELPKPRVVDAVAVHFEAYGR